ncbi:hypothetical protein CERSUDRAFT_95370 [Gelatoporia subvermispora B]|uniref:Uncharacterized protein n=1 Tax=Ceriporiopsis subvermispora (strain B) TaxID=914234 RepID=M2QY75_CERS8|nr:hypothetical protein CERSUDRAFT_95370 [Gelatoporia subvermispora B]
MGTSIPAWAYQSFGSDDAFNVTAAQLLTDEGVDDINQSNSTDVSSMPTPSTSSAVGSSVATSPSFNSISDTSGPSSSAFPSIPTLTGVSQTNTTVSPNTASPSTTAFTKAKTSLGTPTLIGGIVGAVAGLAIVSASALILLRRRRVRKANSSVQILPTSDTRALFPCDESDEDRQRTPPPEYTVSVYDKAYNTGIAANASTVMSYAGASTHPTYEHASGHTGVSEP